MNKSFRMRSAVGDTLPFVMRSVLSGKGMLVVFCLLAVGAEAREATQPARASRPAQTGQVVIVATDAQGGTLPGATVRIEGTAGQAPQEWFTDGAGEVVVDLPPGAYRVLIDMPGFEPVTLSATAQAGETARVTATLEIGGFAEQVAVTANESVPLPTPDGQVETLSQAEIDQLPDDPEELELMLQALAGGDSPEIRVNGFEGGSLPPKRQIQAIRIRRDPFSPDSMGAGQPRVEIITRPGTSEWRGDLDVGFRDQALNARQAFAPRRGEGQTRRMGTSFSGPLVKERTSLSGRLFIQDNFEAQTIVARRADIGAGSLVNQERGWFNGELRVDHAINKAHTLRTELQHYKWTGENLGVGEFELPERAFTQTNARDIARASLMSTFGSLLFNEFRVEYVDMRDAIDSQSDALIVNVPNAFVGGGSQRRGGRRERELEIADNVDLLKGVRHKVRFGFETELGWSRTDRMDNYTGTFTFASLEDFEAGRPRQFTQRTGDPLVTYDRYEFSWYVHDEYSATDNVRLGLGLRHDLQGIGETMGNLAPRLSVAWSPEGEKGPTTYTAGFGVFNAWLPATVYEQSIQLDGERQRDLIVQNPTYPDPFAGGAEPGLVVPSIVRFSDAIAMQKAERVSVGVEHRFTPTVRLQANVYGQLTQDRLRSINANAPVDGERPDARFDRITEVASTGRMQSGGFNASVRVADKENRRSGMFRYNYGQTWNDTDGALSLPADSTDPDAEWGPASWDVRHRIFAFAHARFAAGLRMNLWADIQSGAPYTIRTGFDDNGDTVFTDRPEGVGRNSERGTWQRTVNLRLGWRPWEEQRSANDQTAQPAGQSGPRRRGQERGMELYAQVWNLLNETNYTRFAGVMTSPLFGQATAAAPARRFDFGTRIFF